MTLLERKWSLALSFGDANLTFSKPLVGTMLDLANHLPLR